jgi:hypothetical protein
MATNPVRLALQATRHKSELIATFLSFQFAIAAVEAGAQTRNDLLQLLYLGKMTLALERAGFVFEGMASAEVHTLVQNALEGLNPPDLRQVYDMHRQQCEAASAQQYLKARQTLQIGAPGH